MTSDTIERAETAERSRHLPLAGTYNVRDVGGYTTADGRSTRWNALLRADSLHRLTPADQQQLVDYGVRSVIDLRRGPEIEEWPNVFVGSEQVRYLNLDLVGSGGRLLDSATRWTLADLYRAILDHRQHELRKAFSVMAAETEGATLVHCTAGKDRTGVVVALALALAGVPDNVIAADYALTAQYLTGQYLEEAKVRALSSGVDWDAYQLQLACPEEYMTSTLDYLEATHGGAEAYLRTVGLDDVQIAALRNHLLEA